MATIPVTWLSWNNARLLALILNALTGLTQFYERDHAQLNVDGVFGLRLVQGKNDQEELVGMVRSSRTWSDALLSWVM
ncbi:hypothetical protein AAVH_17760 [Aphelenchoides avenae]|nr:hypothetical protein AAVH_17760 [Aphelenchus avenae]